MSRLVAAMAFDTMIYMSAITALTVSFPSWRSSASLRESPLYGSTTWSTCRASLTASHGPQESAALFRMGGKQHAAARTLHDIAPNVGGRLVANDGLASNVVLGGRATAKVASHLSR